MTRRDQLLLAAIVAAALALAYVVRFGCDDAWISYVYSRSLVEGNGLTWFGDPVEGYTNFLWVLWVAVGLVLGADPLHWAWVGSMAAFAGVLVIAFRTARLRTASLPLALGVVGVLATNFTFLAFATSGLETMLQTLLITAVLFGVERERRRAELSPLALAGISVLAALAIWTRMDSGVPCLVLGVVLAAHLVKRRASAMLWAAAVAPALLLVGGWLAWKLSYYGDVFPNTAHAKLGMSGETVSHGALFVGRFFHAYLLWPVLAVVVVVAIVRRAFTPRLPAAVAVAWLAYVAIVGGDFMEFRFFVPALPALALVIAEVLLSPAEHPRVPAPGIRGVVLVAMLGAASWRHAVSFKGLASDQSYDSVESLGSYYGIVAGDEWSLLGRPFHDVLAGTGATIACQGAGAIPYFAQLPAIDQLGLNDRWIARHGDAPPGSYHRPGHQRFAPLSYLVERRVTFVIGSPRLIDGRLADVAPQILTEWIAAGFARPQPNMPSQITIVAVPVAGGYSLLAWYLHPEPAITERITKAGWQQRVLARKR